MSKKSSEWSIKHPQGECGSVIEHTFSLSELVHFTPNKASQKLLGELVVHDLAYDCSSCEP